MAAEQEPICRYVWHNGAIKKSTEVSAPIWTSGLHYGTGVFEGIRCYPNARGAAVFRLREHMERMVRSARYYGLALKWSAEELSRATVELLKAEAYTSAAYIRPLAF